MTTEKTEKQKQGFATSISVLERTSYLDDLMTGLDPAKMARYLSDLREGTISDAMAVFDQMEKRDPDIKADLGTRKFQIASKPVVVHPADDSKEAAKQADFLRDALQAPAGRQLMFFLADSIGKGISLSQVSFEADGKYYYPEKSELIPSRLLTMRHEEKIIDFPRLLQGDGWSSDELDPEDPRLVWHRHFFSDLASLDTGLLYTLSLHFIIKRYALKDWAAFCEKFGIPMIVGKYAGGVDSATKEKLRKAVQEMNNDLGAVLHENTQIEIIESKGGSQNSPFEMLEKSLRAGISKVCLGQTLATNEAEYGTKAQAVVHGEVRSDLLQYDAFSFEMTLQRIANRLLDLNFSTPQYPRVQLDTKGAASAETIKLAAEIGMELSKKQVREILMLAEPEDEDDILKLSPGLELPGDEKKKSSEKMTFAEKNDREITTADLLQGAIEAGGEIYTNLKERMLSLAEGGDYLKASREIWQELKWLNEQTGKVLWDMTSAAEMLGKVHAAEEMETGEIRLSEEPFSENPVEPELAVQLLKRKPIVAAREYKKLNSKWQMRCFSIAGYDNIGLLGDMRDFLVKAYEDGLSFRKFKDRADAAFAKWGESTTLKDRAKGIKTAKYHLRTVYETNLQMAYSEGRLRQMMDPEVLEERPYWQWMTAGDERVRPLHTALNGKIFHHTVAIQNRLIPPLGFNCRCSQRSLTEAQARSLAGEHEIFEAGAEPEDIDGVPVKVPKGFGRQPEEYEFSYAEFIEEAVPMMTGQYRINFGDLKQNPGRNLRGKAKPVALDKRLSIARISENNPKLKPAEIKKIIRDRIFDKYPEYAVITGNKRYLKIPTVDGSYLVISENSINHIANAYWEKKQDRLPYFGEMIDTVTDPWQIWVDYGTGRRKTSWGLQYLKLYESDRERFYMRVDIIRDLGSSMTTYFPLKNDNQVDKRRSGIALLYDNPDLVEVRDEDK